MSNLSPDRVLQVIRRNVNSLAGGNKRKIQEHGLILLALTIVLKWKL